MLCTFDCLKKKNEEPGGKEAAGSQALCPWTPSCLQGRKLKGSLMGWFEERVSYSLKVTELKRANGVGAEGGM